LSAAVGRNLSTNNNSQAVFAKHAHESFDFTHRRASSGFARQPRGSRYVATIPARDDSFVAAVTDARSLQPFLDRFTTIGEDEHVVMMLDRAGWRGCRPRRPS
jgi:hypothetical protein